MSKEKDCFFTKDTSAADFICTNGLNTVPLFLQCPIHKLRTVNLAEMWGEIIFIHVYQIL